MRTKQRPSDITSAQWNSHNKPVNWARSDAECTSLPNTAYWTTSNQHHVPDRRGVRRILFQLFNPRSKIRRKEKWQPLEWKVNIYCHFLFLMVYLTLILLTWRIWWASNNASKWQMGFNQAFKGLNHLWKLQLPLVWRCVVRETDTTVSEGPTAPIFSVKELPRGNRRYKCTKFITDWS